MRILVPLVFGLLLVLGTCPVVFASTSLPFNGSGSGSFTEAFPTVSITGTGNYEHLGLTQISIAGAITGFSACGGFTAMEQDTFTAANGDTVLLSVHDVFCPTSSPFVFQFTGVFSITGGTGRFIDASGSGTIQGSITFTSASSGTFSGATSGTISY
jgi:hypothetical protein